MLSRNASYAKTPNVVVRTFEDWGHAFAFTPDDPEVHDLNATAWFILDLCNGRPFSQIEADYVKVVGEKIGEEAARTQFHAGFNLLLTRNIIQASE